MKSHRAGGQQKYTIEGLCERTEHIDIFLFFRPSLNRVLFPMFFLLVEGEYQILVFENIIN